MPVTLPGHALTTLGTAKEELGVEGAGNDARIARMILRASSKIAALRTFGFHRQAGAVQRIRGFGGDTIQVSLVPLVSITACEVYGETVDVETLEIVDAERGLIRRPLGWPWTAGRASGISQGKVAGSEFAEIKLTLTGGYVTPQQAEEDGDLSEDPWLLPDDIEGACLESVTALWARKGRDPSLASVSHGSASEAYRGLNTAIGQGLGGIIPDAAWRDLQRYREVRI